ncbi:hypothetical protein HPHPP8B_1378 [Helicobacter pylori Hp P-8b]|nr:hypothetical protein HPHPP8_1385 [Helicobacter pylori Hp P-8]EJC26785.1 hypothetical protein HPHPP8B_1378 [Helicobacter pylori Hp P-8b]
MLKGIFYNLTIKELKQAITLLKKRSSWVRGILRGLRGRVISKYPLIPLRE